MKKVISFIGACAIGVLAFGAMGTSLSGAIPATKLQEVKVIKAQVDALDTRVEIASENYNAASVNYNKAVAKRVTAQAKLTKTKKRLDVVQVHLDDRAKSMYRQGSAGFVEVLFGAESFDDFASVWGILNNMNEDDAKSAQELKQLKAEMVSLTDQLKAEEKTAAAAQATMKNNKDSIEAQLAERTSMLKGVQAEVDALDQAEAAAALSAAAASESSGGGSSGGGRTFPSPTRAPRSQVVAIAKRYLGAPYKWGEDGSNSFDCSGLTSFVYRQVGVSLPHSSRAQINARGTQRVSRADLAPGDLVFFHSPISHVGIYIGGGRMIEAPHHGARVRIASISGRGYVGACRP
ncbi:MAG: C40 family peptidase [Coriobacteriia bacterium]|nr:C40 family peptidase [Coriobacteriia bacterium]